MRVQPNSQRDFKFFGEKKADISMDNWSYLLLCFKYKFYCLYFLFAKMTSLLYKKKIRITHKSTTQRRPLLMFWFLLFMCKQ